ncbi:tRNA 2-selenouridine(34) synthase MnmH [Pseudalkalibacillus sp. SCS-8]|uniref:tRNA 2-selenouridine(34) synthase MnmH n=1 Tax=Pseudalkalibacillus nanhaiensis TaxID=3115291 RepID=UPI0032DA3FA7
MSDHPTVRVLPLHTIHFEDYHIIDVRSPGEFAEFHIEGAHSIPIFNDEERAEVGTTYKQVGKEEAKMLGLSLVTPKLVSIVEKLKELKQAEDKPFLIYCARGGMRSHSVATVVNLMGMTSYQLEGGIRAYRQSIVSGLTGYAAKPKPFFVIEGLTGTRKTDLLEALEDEGYPVLNLERMAGHRGSIFGEIGTVGKSQKMFERELFNRLTEIGHTDYYIIESESKRIGKVLLPDWILNGKEKGTRLYIDYPFEKRVKTICETYEPEQYEPQIREALLHLKKRMAPDLFNDVLDCFDRQDYHQAVRLLLEQYYDPRYRYTARHYQSEPIRILMEDLEEGLAEIKRLLDGFSQWEFNYHLS